MLYGQATIRGKVLDKETGDPLIGANIYIKSLEKGASTDMEGRFTINNLPSDTVDIRCSYMSYTKKVVKDYRIKGGVVNRLTFQLQKSDVEVEEVVVEAQRSRDTEAALMSIKKQSSEMLDGISAAKMAETGDANAAEAVKRIPGVSVQEGKYVYVRGLGDRYSNSTLNKASIPSLDPNRNSVQMDLFPSNLIDNIMTQKTYSPDMPGSFGGGNVNVVTKDFPEEFSLNVSSSYTYNTQATFNDDFLAYEGGKTDWLGIDDGSRELPGIVKNNEVPSFSDANSDSDPQAGQRLYDMTRAFGKNMDFSGRSPFLNQSHSFSIGDQRQLFGNKLGFVFGATYKKSFEYYNDGTFNRYSLRGNANNVDRLFSNIELEDERGQEEALWGLMFNAAYKLSRHHQISVNLNHNQSGIKTARYQEGKKPEDDVSLNYQTRALKFKERSISTGQLQGKHHFPGLNGIKLEWMSSYTKSRQEEPDLRFFTNGYREIGGDTAYSIQPSIGQIPARYFRTMSETNWDNKIDVTIPYKQWSGRDAKLKVGGAYLRKEREFREQQYRYKNSSQSFSGDPVQYISDENLWKPGQSGTDGVYLVDRFQPANNYDGSQEVWGTYAMTDLPLFDRFDLTGGARLEQTNIQLESFDESLPTGELDDLDLLPAVNLNYHLTDQMNLRGSYSRTLARPTFRELAPFGSFDFIGDFVLVGNESLQRTLIDNYDLRWEMFPNPGEVLSVSLFHKKFHDPIEKTFNPTAANPELTYRNVDEARIYGAEFEFRKNLEFLSSSLSNFDAGVNFTYVYSQVDIPGPELESIRELDPDRPAQRAMYGQSPYLVNSFLTYQNKGWKLNANFNIFGERLTIVTERGTPNVFEQPRPKLNLNAKKTFDDRFTISIGAGNVFNPDYRMTYEFKGKEYDFERYTKGRTFSLGFSYDI